MSELVTVHVWTVRPAAVPAAVARFAVDRWHLSRTPGLRFAKLCGTGDGRTFRVTDVTPGRWVLVAVWEDAAALAAFERGSPVARGWTRIADERWRADLRCLRTRGTWAGRQPFRPVARDWDGPVAAITRARLRPIRATRFWRAVPPVATDLNAQSGLEFATGFGEAPVGFQGTLSVWRRAGDLTAFAFDRGAHRAVVDRTPKEGWYAEELFARFAVLQTTGTVDGARLPG